MSTNARRTQQEAQAKSTHDLIAEVSALISSMVGIQLGERQRTMVTNRVHRRIAELGLRNEREYRIHLESNREKETNALVSLLTTHHTYFFREFAHFEFLEKTALPHVIAAKRQNGDKRLRVWSAACSTGQEVYSLSMLIRHSLARLAPDFTYEILGTDVDPASIKVARNGVYKFADLQEMPLHFLNDNWAKGTGTISHFAKARASIKTPCRFEVLNLLHIPNDLQQGAFDIIFCRNVFIYFSAEQVKEISSSLLKALSPHGYLFLGISESLNGLGLQVQSTGPSIYQTRSPQTKNVTPLHPTVPVDHGTKSNPNSAAIASTDTLSAKEPILDVLCVDDSPSILALLKRILTHEAGFRVVGTASNGKEATEWLKHNKADLITLDIHMPVQTGLEFLQTQSNTRRPPVVMISSVSRDDAGLALRCLDAGAADYIEKPSLSDLSSRTDEIRSKLRYAARLAGLKREIGLIREFSHSRAPIAAPERKRRVIVAGLGDRTTLARTLSELQGAQPETVLLVEGAGGALEGLRQTLAAALGDKLRVRKEPSGPNSVSILDAGALSTLPTCETTSLIIFGRPSSSLLNSLRRLKPGQVLLEDLGETSSNASPELRAFATDIVPATSFTYMSDEFFRRDVK